MDDTARTRRLTRARQLWADAESAHAGSRLDEAFTLLTAAHDRVTDIAAEHREAHRRLLPIDRALGRTRDVFVDRLLLFLAPVGSFQLLAIYFRWFEDYSRFEETA